MDYIDDTGYEPSEKSEGAPSDYASEVGSIDELEEQLKLQEQNKKWYNQLMEDKYFAILEFNSGELDADIYFATINKLNADLESLDYFEDQTNELLIEQEIRFKELLDEYISKINKIRTLDKKMTKGFLDYFDLERIKALRYIIKDLQSKYTQKEEPEELFIDLDSLDLEKMVESERINIEERAARKGLLKPVPEQFQTEDSYQNALRIYYERVHAFLFFRPFEDTEMDEIESLARKLKIPKPKSTDPDYETKLIQFYNEVSQLLPGYIFKMNTTSIGYTYQLLNIELMKDKIKNEQELLKERPIKLSLEDTMRTKTVKTLTDVLSKMEQSELIDCVMASGVKVPRIEKPVKKGFMKTMKLKGVNPEKEGTSLKNELSKKLNPKEYSEYIETVQRKRLLDELLVEYERFKERKFVQQIVPSISVSFKETVIPTVIPSGIRNIHKKRLIQSLEKGLPPELLAFVKDTVERMENYIFKIVESNGKYDFIMYSNKIEEILFIFENYPNFKLKLLRPISTGNNMYRTEINIYQIVLFEREISTSARLHVFPVKINTRRQVLKRLINEFFILKPFKSDILNKIMSEKFSKKIELILFGVSQNEPEYLYNVKRVIQLVQKSGKEIIYGKLSIENLVEIVNLLKAEDSEKKASLDKWLNEENEELKKLTYSQYVSKFLTDSTDYSVFTIRQLEVLLNDKVLELEQVSKQGLYPEIVELKKKIKKVNEVLNKRKLEKSDQIRKRYIKYLTEKFGPAPPPMPVAREPIQYVNLSLENILELVNAFKRRLILYDISVFKVYPVKSELDKPWGGVICVNFDYLPEHIAYPDTDTQTYELTTESYTTISEYSQRGRVVSYMELYDLNELYNKTKVNGANVIDARLYQKIKAVLVAKINGYLNGDYSSINNTYQKRAISFILELFGITKETNTITEKLQLILENWPKFYQPNNQVLDFYGMDLFYKLTQVSNPVDFYNYMELRNYQVLVDQNKVQGVSEFRKPMILFNEAKGKFGSEAYDGLLYAVEMLDKDHSTQLPIPQSKVIMEKDPRTGNWLAVNKQTFKRGPYAFIKRFIGTSQIGEVQEIWMEVPKSAVKLYTFEYDSCSRFRNKSECVGPGLNNSTCVFKAGRCVADYTKPFAFGKKPVGKKTRSRKFGKNKK
jgi:hypothetical protein